MASLQTEALVIGGGSTGAGVARDAAMRGLRTVLVERKDLADGTTGRFHGLLHSGGRYAVKDPDAAKECIAENAILRQTASDCIEDTGGLFVCTPWDDPAFGDEFVAGCRATGVPVEEIRAAEALRREPRLTPALAGLHGSRRRDRRLEARLGMCPVRGGVRRRILLYHRVLELERDGRKVTGALVRNELTGEELRIHADVVINAAGAWAGQIAELAGCRVNVLPGKGIMIAMNHRLVNTVVNRCKMPADGDIIVPIRTVCVVGTTDTRVADPDELEVTQAEIGEMLDEGEKLVPGFREARALRVWAGARPLFSLEEVSDDTGGHAITRASRPPRARRRRRARDDHRRQDDDVSADGRAGRGCRVRTARRRSSVHGRPRSRSRAPRTGVLLPRLAPARA